MAEKKKKPAPKKAAGSKKIQVKDLDAKGGAKGGMHNIMDGIIGNWPKR